MHMSAGHRNVVYADGSPFLLVGDTAWSLPWRGTAESVAVYAEDRQSKGFNAVLLMSIQPDRKAVGPRIALQSAGLMSRSKICRAGI